MTETRTLQFENARAVQSLYANDFKLLKNLEESLGVKVTTREGWIKLEGDAPRVEKAERVFEQLEKARQRGVDVRALKFGNVEKISGDKVKQGVKVRSGIESDRAKKITRLVKDSKLKVQAAIQGEAVRITGAKRDDLQAAMALIRKEITDVPLSFDNFRD